MEIENTAMTDRTRIILLDDNEWELFLHHELLLLYGIRFEIETYTSPTQVIDMLKGKNEMNDYIILCDLHMPGMNGFEFIDQVSKLPYYHKNKISIFLLSATVDYDEIRKAKTYECVNGVLSKPLNVDALLSQLSGKKLASV